MEDEATVGDKVEACDTPKNEEQIAQQSVVNELEASGKAKPPDDNGRPPTPSSSSEKKTVRFQRALEKPMKCLIVGDSKTGKTSLVHNFLYGKQKLDYVPTTQDDHTYATPSAKGKENQNGMLHICDTGGQLEMDRLRPLCYTNARTVIICFSVMNPASFANVTSKWLPEVKRHCKVTEDPANPLKLLLVGTQSDLRSNVGMLLKLMDDGLTPISETRALRLASKIGALKYIESSSLNGSNVNHIFDFVMACGEKKVIPKHLTSPPMNTGFSGKILPNLTERKLIFWRKWRLRQNKSSKVKRLVLMPCLF